jgi:hypothetical protein
MNKFEYLVIRKKITEGIFDKPVSPEKELNEFGERGWELVSVNTDSKTKECVFFFKRGASK